MKSSIYWIILAVFLFHPFISFAQEPLSDREVSKLNKLRIADENYRKENWPPAPTKAYRRGTLGLALQDPFMSHCKGCGFEGLNTDGDFIPPAFLPDNWTTKKVITVPDVGTKYLFSYLFSRDEIEKLEEGSFDFRASNRLNIEASSDISLFGIDTTRGITAGYVSLTCSGYIGAQASFDLAPKTIFELGVKAETDVNKRGAITAVYGAFSSPVLEPKGDRELLATYALLWNYYRDHPDRISDTYLLRDFNGALTSRFNEQQLNSSLDIGLRLNYKAAIRVDGNARLNNLLRVGQWNTYIITEYESDFMAAFKEAETVEKIQEYFKRTELDGIISKETPVILPNSRYTLSFYVKNVNKDFNRDWSLIEWDSTIYQEEPDLKVHYPGLNPACQKCIEFEVTGQVASNFHINTESLNEPMLKFKFKGNPIEINGENEYLVLSGSSRGRLSRHPEINFNSDITQRVITIESVLSNSPTISWEFEGEINDRENPIDFQKVPVIENLQVEIDEAINEEYFNVGDKIPYTVKFSLSPDSSKLLIIEAYSPINKDEINRVDATIKGTLTGKVILTTKSGYTVERKFSKPIAIPTLKDSGAPTSLPSNLSEKDVELPEQKPND